MLNIISRKVVAIGIAPRIDEYERDRIQELLDGEHPMSSIRKNYDTGTKRKTVLDKSPVGPNEISESNDERTSHSNVGSGGTKGIDTGGRADDETGPGNTPNKDPEQQFTSSDNAEIAFLSDSDKSSKWSPLNFQSNIRDQRATTHLMRLYRQPEINTIRHDVDKLVQNRLSSSNWNHEYV